MLELKYRLLLDIATGKHSDNTSELLLKRCNNNKELATRVSVGVMADLVIGSKKDGTGRVN